MRVVFMGTPAFAVPSLEALANSDHEVVGVVTQPDRPKDRGQAVVPCPVKELALAKGLPVSQPDKIKSPEFLQQLAEWKPDVIAVTAFGRILPKPILDLPPMGCVNVHGSLLPAYRGAAPIQWALIHGDTETGITTMVMDEGMDTGAVLLQQTIPIEPEDTALELGARMARVGGVLLVETLTRLAAQTVVPCAQDHSRATMAPLLKKEDGVIDWTQSATEIANRIRGLSPWPGSYTFHHEHRLIIRKGRVDAQGGPAGGGQRPGTILAVGPQSFWVETGAGRIEVLEVQPANKKRMSVEQFLLGYTLRAQDTLSPQPNLS
ncbi:MAG: methionyl-tRNA formyltransferase [Nitrospira sp. SB0662_bin_26]|nr:methionyl-tRNA formyltransferase [Nitrospira sp. SB0662_bin_26]